MAFTELQAAEAAKALGVDFETTRYTLHDFLGGLTAFDMSYQKGVIRKSEKTEYKTLSFELEDYDEEQGIFSGYAAVFNTVDNGGDIIEPGAFTKTIAEGTERVKILSQHNDYDLPIGRPIVLREDAHGLYIKGQISDTATGRDVKTLLKDKVLNELSIGYDPVTFDYDKEDGVRHLRELKLWEVSIVTWAMHPDATITGYKAAEAADRANQMATAVVADLKEGRKISTVRLKTLKEACTTLENAIKVLRSVVKEAEVAKGDKLTGKDAKGQRKMRTKPIVEITFNT